MIVADFEVFKYNWLVVFLDLQKREYTLIHDNKYELTKFYNDNKNDIYIGYNFKNYDKYIYQAILSNINPYLVSQHIVEYKLKGYDFTDLDNNKYPLYIFDCMNITDGGLKTLEGMLGNDIQETGVSFDIDRPLTQKEIDMAFEYCIHDVEQTTIVSKYRFSKFQTYINLINKFKLSLNALSNTDAKMSEQILGAKEQQTSLDQFDISLPSELKLDKYKYIADWYLEETNHNYNKKLDVNVCGIQCIFAWGGLHGAKPKYISDDECFYCMIDVTSLYPSIMIIYNLLSRSLSKEGKELYQQIYYDRIKLKYGNDNDKQLSNAYKLILNVTYGAMKSVYNKMYDTLHANLVCIYGQLFILDLCEKLEQNLDCEFIQINTDGILIKLDECDNNKMKKIIEEWENRTKLKMDYTYFSKIIQKDVNNYIAISKDGSYKCKGAYVKKSNDLDYNLNIVKQAIKDFFINDILPEDTINACDDLREFQSIVKLTNKYKAMYHNNTELNGHVFRVFASNSVSDSSLYKSKDNNGVLRFEKVANTPQKAFICNEDINDKSVNNKYLNKLDKSYYIQLAYDRISDFGYNHNNFGQLTFDL